MNANDKAEIALIVAEAVKQIGTNTPPVHLSDASMQTRLDELRRVGQRPAKWVRRFPCKSPLTGATFYLEVQGYRALSESEAHALGLGRREFAETPLEQGQVTNLDCYRDAPGTYRHESHIHDNGPMGTRPCNCGVATMGPGRVPPHVPIWDGVNITNEWRTWYKDNHFVLDSRQYVRGVSHSGFIERRFDPSIVIDEKDMNILDQNIGTPMAVASTDPYMRAPA